MEKGNKFHVTPRGANDARPTTLCIINDENLEGKWSDKVVLVTGGGSSIGAETARALHATGVTVFITVRDRAKGEAAIDQILKSDPTNTSPIHMIPMILDDFDSIRNGHRLNLLVCNAGVMATPYGLTSDGYETQFATNHLSHFLLFQLLKPALLASSTQDYNSRVVMVSSFGHRLGEVRFNDYNFSEGYDPAKAYAQSKTANIYMANAIDRYFGSQGLHALSLHPGGIRSGLQTHVREIIERVWELPDVKRKEKTAAQGAATTVYAAVRGRYLSSCMEMGLFRGEDITDPRDEGYAAWAYDQEKEDRLWADSLKMVGISDQN
ncbi:hypothetical protein F5884DRAFT_847883 [Xylogone sp. PMI_703]|nr:hypothetical protein F5884DRAFT_847883 [Xylogone sp. PMI_703]